MEPFVLDLDPSDAEDSELLKDVRALVTLPPPARAAILGNLGGLLGGESERTPDVINRIMAAGVASLSRLERAMRCLESLLAELDGLDADFSVTEWVAAWERALPREDFHWFEPEIFAQVVESLRAFCQSKSGHVALLERATQRAAIGILPSFMGVETTVDARAVHSNRKAGSVDGDYSPEIIAVTPVVTVNIRVNRGPREEFAFQLDVEELDDLRSSLDAAAKDASALIRFIRSSSTQRGSQ